MTSDTAAVEAPAHTPRGPAMWTPHIGDSSQVDKVIFRTPPATGCDAPLPPAITDRHPRLAAIHNLPYA